MSAWLKLIVFLIAFVAIFLFSPRSIFAQVVINEFLPNPTQGSDWVELYNSTDQDVNLDNWILDDEGTKTNMVEIEEATISAHGFRVFEVGSRLNKSGDVVYLINNQGTIVDEYCYSSNPGDGVSLGRVSDGGEWGICQQPTPESENSCFLLSPSVEPSPDSEPTQTPSSISNQTPSPIAISISNPKPIKVTGAALLGKVLGEESSPAGFYPWEATEEAENQEATGAPKTQFIPKLFLCSGLVFLVVSGLYLWFTQRAQLK